MTTIRRIIKLHSLLAMSMVSSLAQASAVIPGGPDISLPRVVFTPRDILAGTTADTVLYTGLWVQGGGLGAAGGCRGLKLDMRVDGVLVDDTTGTYGTGLNGVGLRFAFVSPNGSEHPFPASTTIDVSGPEDMANATYKIPILTKLVATGDQIEAGQTSLATLPSVVVTPTRASFESCVGAPPRPITAKMRPFAVTATTCQIQDASRALDVQLPAITISDLTTPSHDRGVTNIPISLLCDKGVRVAMTLSSIDALPGEKILRSNRGTAQGVGLEILNPQGDVVTFGADSSVAGNPGQFFVSDRTAAADQFVNVMLRARYVTTGTETVKPGTLNAVATYTLSYQ